VRQKAALKDETSNKQQKRTNKKDLINEDKWLERRMTIR